MKRIRKLISTLRKDYGLINSIGLTISVAVLGFYIIRGGAYLMGYMLNENEPPVLVEGRYNKYRARSIREGHHFNITLTDTIDEARVYGRLYVYEGEACFPEIGAGIGPGRGLPLSHPLSKYQNPDSLLAVHKALRNK